MSDEAPNEALRMIAYTGLFCQPPTIEQVRAAARRARAEQNGSPWVDLANGDTVPFRLHDDYRLGRISDGGWPTRDADGR